MATITTAHLLLLGVLVLLAVAMEMMPLHAPSAGILLIYMVWENYFLHPFYCEMATLKKGQKSLHMMKFGFIIRLVWYLGCLCELAFGQTALSETLTGSVTFPALGLTCIGNLVVFYRCTLRGTPKLEIGAKDIQTTITGQKLNRAWKHVR